MDWSAGQHFNSDDLTLDLIETEPWTWRIMVPKSRPANAIFIYSRRGLPAVSLGSCNESEKKLWLAAIAYYGVGVARFYLFLFILPSLGTELGWNSNGSFFWASGSCSGRTPNISSLIWPSNRVSSMRKLQTNSRNYLAKSAVIKLATLAFGQANKLNQGRCRWGCFPLFWFSAFQMISLGA